MKCEKMGKAYSM